MPIEPKPKCPDCGVELVLVNNELPDECAKCGFVLTGYEPFKRWLKTATKELASEQPTPKRRGLFDGLNRKKGS